VHGTHSRASGPISYMRVFDKSCETLESAGARRGAQMGMMRCDHPDIEDFIHAKRDGSLANFNMSVAVTDAFMRAVESDGEVELWHDAEAFDKSASYQRADGSWVYRKARARDLFDQIMQSTTAMPSRRHLHRPRQRRQQPVVLRDHRGDEPMWRATASALWLLLPRLDQPDALRR